MIPLAKVVILAWGIILALILFALTSISIGGRTVLSIRGLDPMYYFGTAHSLLFDHDFDLRNEFAVLNPQATSAGGFRGQGGLPGSPYAVGYSLLSLPFLAVGTAVDAAAGRSADGYAKGAVFCFFLGNVTFTVIGMWCLAHFLQEFGSPPWQAAFLPLAIWFSTSLGYYTFSPMSHAATFMMSSGFLLTWWRTKESGRVRDWATLGLCGGLLSICRWQDAIFLIGPLLADVSRCRVAVARRWFVWVAYLGAAGMCWIPQITQWKILYGKYITIPQGPGFLEFPPRFILNVLFSTNHGWFLWTPITLIGIVGLLYGTYRTSAARGYHYWPWIVVVFLEVAVIGSMPYNWNGMDSFSVRSLTSCVPLVTFGIAVLLRYFRPLPRRLLYGAIVLCMAYSTIFAAQYRLDRIRPTNPGQARAAFHLAGVSCASSDSFLWARPGRTASR
ncbi:MAG: hypothetical protein LAO55_24320 [Acidobacteriia bacterium]|nr:hypothetical protein [Terriglobia bacterium]